MNKEEAKVVSDYYRVVKTLASIEDPTYESVDDVGWVYCFFCSAVASDIYYEDDDDEYGKRDINHRDECPWFQAKNLIDNNQPIHQEIVAKRMQAEQQQQGQVEKKEAALSLSKVLDDKDVIIKLLLDYIDDEDLKQAFGGWGFE